jgi:hypothetical protein
MKPRFVTISLFVVLSFLLCRTLSSQTAVSGYVKNAQAAFAGLDAQNAYADNLNRVDMNMLPSGFRQTIGNMDVTVVVSGAEYHAEYTELETFLRLIIPEEKEKTLFFGAKSLKLSHDGDIIGDAKLALLGDMEIPVSDGNIILRLKGNFDTQTGQSADLTYATIDCKGLKGMGLSAEVELSENLCSPVDNNGKMIAGKVTGHFQTQIDNWSDIVASVSFPSFVVNGLNGFIWKLEDAVFDFSDLKNATGFQFPEGYESGYIVPGTKDLWKGVYVRNLSITLPPEFAKDGDRRVSFSARDMIIDDNGITGKFGASNILSIKEGNAGGWAFSVDYFGLELMANRLEGALFNGELSLPISEESRLKYDGIITEDDKYFLKIQSLEGLAFDMLGGKMDLFPNSYVEFKSDKGKFLPEAMLHGRMGIDVKMKQGGKEIAQFKGIEFRSLHLKTEDPYLNIEYLGYQEELKLANFPVSVKSIAMTTRGNEASLGFDIDLTLCDGNFYGSTRLAIVGKMEEGKLHKWKYEKVEIEGVRLEAMIAETFQLKGELLILNDDPVYGDGFSGSLSLSFTDKSPLKGFNLKARAMFGRKDFRYWFVDGIAEIPGIGIPVAPCLNLIGFGGGVSYKMKPAGIEGSGGMSLSATSMVYTPNENSSIGIKASVAFAVPVKNVIHGEACFELSFNKNGGLDYAGFYGFAQFAGAIPGLDKFEQAAKDKYQKVIEKEKSFVKNNEQLAESLRKMKQYDPNAASQAMMPDQAGNLGKSGIAAVVGIQFNFAESSFHSTFDLYVNLLGGIITGTASGNRAGYGVIHIDSREWYAYMGTPTDRIGLKMAIGNILSVETGSYLMVGNRIPEAPKVPEEVASILGYSTDDLNYMKDLNTLDAGKGFAFGASLSIRTGDLTFLIIYANYSMGMGFDIMLKDYGEAQCKGRSGAIGINGWYANGQSYAYMHGELGVKVNLWFMKAKIPVITADMAALMQAKLPNPSSFKAYLAIKANVLGLISVNCRFKLLVGEDCELIIPGGSPLDMAMISDLSPADKSGDISVFTAPQATFNMPIGKAFDMQDDTGEKTFRIQLKDFVLSDGQDITGQLKWNREKDAVSFYAHEILPPGKDITATVRVVFEELKNGRWTQVYTSGKEAIESKAITFHTGNAPRDIPLQNILYAWPVVDQQYFLKGEGSKGYVQLQFGQNYLFPSGFRNRAVYEDATGNRQTVDFTYNESQKRMEYTIPAVNRTASYSATFASMSQGGDAGQSGAISQTLLDDKEDGSISVASKQASAETRTDIGVALLSYGFATSRYDTFRDKIQSINKTRPVATVLSSDVLMFGYETEGMEPFDMAELRGTEQTENKPLVDVSATLDDSYYRQKIYPLIYQNYPVDGIIKVKRNTEETGIPPAKALPVRSDYLTQIEQGLYDGLVKRRFPYYYNLPAVYREDFTDLQNQVVNRYLGKGGATYNHFLQGTFPFISSENYNIRMQYVMPGDVKGSEVAFEFYNFVK